MFVSKCPSMKRCHVDWPPVYEGGSFCRMFKKKKGSCVSIVKVRLTYETEINLNTKYK